MKKDINVLIIAIALCCGEYIFTVETESYSVKTVKLSGRKLARQGQRRESMIREAKRRQDLATKQLAVLEKAIHKLEKEKESETKKRIGAETRLKRIETELKAAKIEQEQVEAELERAEVWEREIVQRKKG